jgi:coenzyme Q-binding protein COQ10
MKHFHSRRIVNFRATDMFALVKDVESYPQFVPLCQDVFVRDRRLDRGGREILLVDMRVGFRPIRETVTTRVACDPGPREIKVENVEGPFRSLESDWRFDDEPGEGQSTGSIVDFAMHYQLKSQMLDLLAGAMLDQAFSRYADAFVRRAQNIYGDTELSGKPRDPAAQARRR